MNKEPPSWNTIFRRKRNLQNRWSAAHSARRGRLRGSDQRITQVQDLFQETPTLSIRAVERQLNFSRSSIQRILRQRIQLFPYRITNHQALGFIPKRKAFICFLVLQEVQIRKDTYLVFFLRWEKFPLILPINTQNNRVYCTNRPCLVNEVSRGEKLSWSGGIANRRTIGPCSFSETTVLGETYRNMLSIYAVPRIRSF